MGIYDNLVGETLEEVGTKGDRRGGEFMVKSLTDTAKEGECHKDS